ncbi:MAG: hypothetical protein KatS3mg114_0391 [Planctomycetaceae bacterium]|nr:MAG: hypothetical protein KatS3mg114_0391 [Planctomycetaceae bacterium]
MLRAIPIMVWASVLFTSAEATAQWFRWGAMPCDCAPPVMSYATACDACASVQTTCLQPVMQTVYRQVPVVEYQPVRETVKRPILETKFVDQAVTEYRPVTETRMIDVPTVTYQDVTECRTICRNMGYWRTRYEPICKISPCEYDNRPGLIGWMNRSSYELASLLTPPYRPIREYVPHMVVQTVPVTRRVAIQGTRQVAYQVTNLVPYQTTRKVAVTETKWVDQEITVMKPTTVVKTIPVGTQITYQPIGMGSTATAIRPIPETTIQSRGNSPTRSAGGSDPLRDADPNKPGSNKLRSATEPKTRNQLTPTAQDGAPSLLSGLVNPAVAQQPAVEPTAEEAAQLARQRRWLPASPSGQKPPALMVTAQDTSHQP